MVGYSLFQNGLARRACAKPGATASSSLFRRPTAYHLSVSATSSLALDAANNTRWRLIGFAAFPMRPAHTFPFAIFQPSSLDKMIFASSPRLLPAELALCASLHVHAHAEPCPPRLRDPPNAARSSPPASPLTPKRGKITIVARCVPLQAPQDQVRRPPAGLLAMPGPRRPVPLRHERGAAPPDLPA